ncbi:hypothetical protein DFH09DRAFT_1464401 [Mycena vulgaris]|nr:hypothetical protein DFH09DRAFT_1464401 [Mycena vulgaris]
MVPMTARRFLLQARYRFACLALVQALFCLFILNWRLFDLGSTYWECGSDSNLVSPGQKRLLLNGPPNSTFRANLRPDLKYITSWPANGWSNQVIEFMNLIYLANMTERVPIVPRFRPVHLDVDGTYLDFGEVFDIPRLEEGVGKPILEWREVKDVESEMLDGLGCWDIQDKTWENDLLYLEPPVDLNLDLSYTLAPQWIRSFSDGGGDSNLVLWPLASLAIFNQGAPTLRNMPVKVSPTHQLSLPPDNQLFCCNSLYFGISALEDPEDISPAWKSVGRHMHLVPKIQEVAASYTRQTLGVEHHEQIPPYIAVHVRRGDFSIWCNIDGVAVDLCFAPLSAFARRVKEVQAELLQRTGTVAERVIITSDEEDEVWWESVYELGWFRPNHAETIALHGSWYPIFIDAAIHGAAAGFVGTATSTVSILARRRVESRGGVTEMVKWGTPFADYH